MDHPKHTAKLSDNHLFYQKVQLIATWVYPNEALDLDCIKKEMCFGRTALDWQLDFKNLPNQTSSMLSENLLHFLPLSGRLADILVIKSKCLLLFFLSKLPFSLKHLKSVLKKNFSIEKTIKLVS